MINQGLLKYIKDELAKGTSRETITSNLIAGGGWTIQEINFHFEFIQASPSTISSANVPVALKSQKQTSLFKISALAGLFILLIAGGAFGYYHYVSRQPEKISPVSTSAPTSSASASTTTDVSSSSIYRWVPVSTLINNPDFKVPLLPQNVATSTFYVLIDKGGSMSSRVTFIEFGKDKSYVYQSGDNMVFSTVQVIDANSFEALGGDPSHGLYYKDKNAVYFDRNVFGEGILEEVSGADLASFVVDMSILPFVKDKNHVFARSSLVLGADPATFILYDFKNKDAENGIHYYAHDANHVYFYGFFGGPFEVGSIEGADVSSFVQLSNNKFSPGYSKDRSNVYWFFTIVDGADSATFEVDYGKLESGAEFDSKDKNGYFLGGKKIYPTKS